MIDWTYNHFRMFMRIIAPKALSYTEMQTPDAIEHNPGRSLYFNQSEAPLAMQLGGGDKLKLMSAAKLAEDNGYLEINLNLGCPSPRVQSGRFGACLMDEPLVVADCIAAMKSCVQIPVTAKTRIGIDNNDSYEFFEKFVRTLIEAGSDKIIVHARKAWLHGLSPKQNRTIPPINYDYVYKVKQAFPNIPFVINGNITTIDEINAHLEFVDGVMLGRIAYQNPYAIAKIHNSMYPDIPLLSRQEVLNSYYIYIHKFEKTNVSISLLLKPLYNLFHGQPGASLWKERLMIVQQAGSINALGEIINSF
jgi:tRNA-dihydrouridine synthase A